MQTTGDAWWFVVDLGASYFTVYVLSCGTERKHRATGVGEDEEGGALKILL